MSSLHAACHRSPWLLPMLLLLAAPAVLFSASQSQTGAAVIPSPSAASSRVWLDVDGNPLPFKTDEELLEFLRTAAVTSEKEISTGVTLPRKLTLEKDGTRAHAIFRTIDQEKTYETFAEGAGERFFRDSYLFEPAAYEMSRLLGLDNVPPATLRKVAGRAGSVQIWVERAQTEETRAKRKLEPPDPIRWAKQAHVMNLFDQLVYNTDRTRNNILITPDWKIWMIDHTRAFRKIPTLLDDKKVKQCDRVTYEHLKALDETTVRERLKDYLRKDEISALMKRRDLIVKKIEGLIVEKGDGAVLFSPAQ